MHSIRILLFVLWVFPITQFFTAAEQGGPTTTTNCTYTLQLSPDDIRNNDTDISAHFCSDIHYNEEYMSCDVLEVNVPEDDIIILLWSTTCNLQRNITIQCTNTFTFRCDAKTPCFSMSENTSFSIVDCNFFGQAVSARNERAELFVQRSSFHGLNTAIPIVAKTVYRVVIMDSVIQNGKSESVGCGGGCLSITGLNQGGVVLDNVTIRRCVSFRDGGCVFISSEAVCAVDMRPTNTMIYGGGLVARNSVFEYCESKMSRGGVMVTRFVTSATIEDCVFRHGVALLVEGCLQLMYIGPEPILFRRNSFLNCTSKTEDSGCATISPRNDSATARHEIQDVTFDTCTSSDGIGAVDFSKYYGYATFSNLTFINCVTLGPGGAISFELVHGGADVRNLTFQHVIARGPAGYGGAMRILACTNMTFHDVLLEDVQANMSAFAAVINATLIQFENVRAPATRSVRKPCLLGVFGESEGITYKDIRFSCAEGRHRTHRGRTPVDGVTYTYTSEEEFEARVNIDITSTPSIPPRSTTETLTTVLPISHHKLLSAPRMNFTFITPEALTTTATSTVRATQLLSISAESMMSASWLGFLLYDCNNYSLSIIEHSVFGDDISAQYPPRMINLFLMESVVGVVAVVEVMGCTVYALVMKVTYADNIHPSLTLRAFMFYMSDFIAAIVACMTAKHDAESYYPQGWTVISLGAIILAVVTVVSALTFLGVNVIRLLPTYKSCYEVDSDYGKPKNCCGAFIAIGGHWKDTPSSHGIVMKYGVLFTNYEFGRASEGMCICFALSIVQGILSGLQLSTQPHCAAMYGVSSAMYLTTLLYVTFLRKGALHHTYRDRIAMNAILVSLVIGNGIRCMEHVVEKPNSMLVYVASVVAAGLLVNLSCTAFTSCVKRIIVKNDGDDGGRSGNATPRVDVSMSIKDQLDEDSCTELMEHVSERMSPRAYNRTAVTLDSEEGLL